jgi:hypothetical protein
MSDYFIKASDEKEIYVIDVKPVLTELKRLGTNINQIARRVNSGFFRPRNFDEVIEQQKKINENLTAILEKL